MADRTERRIPDLLPSGAVTRDTRLVVTNAVYFKARWWEEFSKDKTRTADFAIAPGRTEKVPMMYQEQTFQYAALTVRGVPCAALELSYKGSSNRMLVLLPDARDGLSALEAKIDPTFFVELRPKLRSKVVDLAMPRFRIARQLDRAADLAAMGMPLAFSPSSAGFSGMDGARDISLGSVIHEAFIAVDEEGTEAAAVTVQRLIGAVLPPPERVSFHADHPFLFVVHDDQTILFMGHVRAP